MTTKMRRSVAVFICISFFALVGCGSEQPTGTLEVDVYGWGPLDGQNQFTPNIPEFPNATSIRVRLTKPRSGRVVKEDRFDPVEREGQLPSVSTGRNYRLEFDVFGQQGGSISHLGAGATPLFDYTGDDESRAFRVMIGPAGSYAPVGYVDVSGGQETGGSQMTVERAVFDSRGVESDGDGEPNLGRVGQSAVPFDGGSKVLVVGGGAMAGIPEVGGLPELDSVRRTIQVFDVADNTFTNLTHFNRPEQEETTDEQNSDGDQKEPARDRLDDGRAFAEVVQITKRQFVVVGGVTVRASQTRALKTIEIIDLTQPPGERVSVLTDSTGSEQALSKARVFHTASYLKGSRQIAVVGGMGSDGASQIYSSIELINVNKGTTQTSGSLERSRAMHRAVNLSGTNSIWILGGRNQNKVHRSTASLTPKQEGGLGVSPGEPMNRPRFAMGVRPMPRVGANAAVVVGGYSSLDGAALADFEIGRQNNQFFTGDSWSLQRERGRNSVFKLKQTGEFVVLGGRNSDGSWNGSAERLMFQGLNSTPPLEQIGAVAESTEGRFLATPALLSSGNILVTGGASETGNGIETLNNAEYYIPAQPAISVGGGNQ